MRTKKSALPHSSDSDENYIVYTEANLKKKPMKKKKKGPWTIK